MVEKWRKAGDENNVIGIVFIDYKKAYDSIPHKQLLFKLQRSGLSGNLLEWIQNYLTNRLQYTKIGKENSELQHVKYGVPQGSVLGPLLFATYCDDLPSCVETEGKNIEMYPDDTTLYCIRNTVDQVAELLNTVLTRIDD